MWESCNKCGCNADAVFYLVPTYNFATGTLRSAWLTSSTPSENASARIASLSGVSYVTSQAMISSTTT